MKLFYSPLACSLATRIALEELGREADYVQVDHTTRLAPDGSVIHPLGMVPVLHTDDGKVLTENAAILQYVADGTPLSRTERWEAAELRRWLSFVGTELHKVVFIPLLDKKAPAGAKEYALASSDKRLGLVNEHLKGREFLLDGYSVADIYLATILNWMQVTPLRLGDYHALASFMKRMHARPAVSRSLELEAAAFRAERSGAEEPPAPSRATPR